MPAAMLWKLVCISTLASGIALTAAAPQPIYPRASPIDVAAVKPSAAVPSAGYFGSNSTGHVKRQRATNAKNRKTSTVISSSTASPVTSSDAPTETAAPGSNPRADCSCGYIMGDHADAYYPLAIVVDFAQVSSIDEFPGLGLTIANGRIGGVNRDDDVTACHSTPDNVRLTGGAMELVVPGGQSMGGIVTGAEIRSIDKMISGHLTMTAQLSPVHGTCQALFTYIDEAGYPMAGDEQDIEVLGQSIDEGMILTVYNPETYHTQSLGDVIPFPAPPTVAYHDYTLFWPPASASPRQTSYFFDGQHIKTFDKFSSVNPSGGYINHWSNGQLSFTQGPPMEDAVMRIQALAWYYSSPEVPGMPAGCSMEHACRV